ncbi:LLM class flavin-dependent oxidoreductase [Actinotalea sp.]|uniref:LLM class flavin-dependent oxidoreductase n=1 Tax=Actinotalea sp. TaxID=1872145 RepID=UPI002BA310FA|nr:LLM class flavin-dependent oxidoreductase [Actinotalea sp.]HQY34691.1 LLM class flavin-dependent oxidoreductase [Actinotalea sp.]HRA51702.1 LLM class flavin-dependent oxidoreductase [Actinotalea sp.]
MSRLPAVGIIQPRDLPAHRLVGFARRVEELGFAELWVVEDLGFHGGFAQAATALAVTERIGVALGIVPAAARHPVFLAMEAATLAALHPGRLTIGIGHGMPGWLRSVGAWPASPLGLLEETTTTVRDLLHGREVRTEGRYVRIDGVRLAAPPERVPPVVLGVRGPRSLALSGRVADGTVLAEPVTPAYLAAARHQIAAPGPHPIAAFTPAAVDDDIDRARAAVLPVLAWVGEADVAPHLVDLPFAAELADLRARSADPRAFAAALPADWVDQLAVVGTPAVARARLASLGAAGASTVVLAPVGPDPFAALESLAAVL